MEQAISKSQFKAQLLSYLRHVEKRQLPLIITHGGIPVAKVIPYKKKSVLDSLRNTIVAYKEPTEPVGAKSWESLA